MKNKKLSGNDRILFEKIIENATMDCHDEDEQIIGWFCVLEENIKVPCECLIRKQEAVLKEIEQTEEAILGLVEIGKIKVRTPIEDINFEDEEAMKYLEAYKYWRQNET